MTTSQPEVLAGGAAALLLTDALKEQQNRAAAQQAALIALLYSRAVDPSSQQSVDRWLEIVVPRLIVASDDGAITASEFYSAIRRADGVTSPFRPSPTLGMVDAGVAKSLLAVGPYAYMNKMSDIRRLDLPPERQRALIVEAKESTTKAVAAAVVRHAQAGSRQTIIDNSLSDRTALGWVRVTRPEPCWFCAMLASRGITYRPFREQSFDDSDARFSGPGDAKVHDSCGCSIKPVFSDSDSALKRIEPFADMWSRWGAGGGDAALRFRRGYDYFVRTGEYLTYEQAESGVLPS